MTGSAADLGALRVYPTADGSFSLHSDHFGEAFHNSAGAISEAMAKYALPSELARFAAKPVRVLDVCVGLGYNSAALLESLPKTAPSLQWWGLELDPRPLQFALSQPDFRILWSQPVLERLEAIQTHDGWQESNSKGTMLWGDARRMLQRVDEGSVDLILHDAFSPGRCPQLWSKEFLQDLASCLAPGGRLLTYCRAAAVRSSLETAGLELYSLLPAPGERPGWSSGTLAIKDGDTALASSGPGWRSLSPMEREHLQTRAAVPFRDPCGDFEAAEILANRDQEQRRCGLEATNAWQRRWRGAGPTPFTSSL